MKELSIEEKARRYDEAIEKFDVILNLNTVKESETIFADDVRKILPELKESEDERIRKEIITFIVTTPKERNNHKKWIAWLEAQGEHDNFRNKIQIGDKVTRNEDGVLVNLSQLNRVAKKQDEQKPTEWHREDEQNLNTCLGYIPDEFLRRWLTDIIHIKYDKPADKVEPKIKAGDWVVCNNSPHHIFQVIERSWPNAKYRNINGTELFLNVNTLDKQYHLWTIQDAKDGDVLADDVGIILFRKIGNEKYADVVDYYCAVYTSGQFKIQKEICFWGYSREEQLRPATKEQRERFFATMCDAGYEWDADKKELKKIVAPIFHIGDRVRYKGHACDGVITEITDTDYICVDAKLPISTQDKLELVEQKPAEEYNITGIRSKNAQGKLGEMIKNLKPVNEVLEHDSAWGEKYIADVFEKVGLAKIAREQGNENLSSALQSALIELGKFMPQQKQEWSEEDEYYLNSCITKIEIDIQNWEGHGKTMIDVDKEIISWLKSLKDRVQSQPKQEWSEEDEKMYNVVHNLAWESYKTSRRLDIPTFGIINDWLKSLRPQNTWKPSDEQMKALNYVVNLMASSERPTENDLYYNILKSLRQQLMKLKG